MIYYFYCWPFCLLLKFFYIIILREMTLPSGPIFRWCGLVHNCPYFYTTVLVNFLPAETLTSQVQKHWGEGRNNCLIFWENGYELVLDHWIQREFCHLTLIRTGSEACHQNVKFWTRASWKCIFHSVAESVDTTVWRSRKSYSAALHTDINNILTTTTTTKNQRYLNAQTFCLEKLIKGKYKFLFDDVV